MPHGVFVLLLSRFCDTPDAATPFVGGAQALIEAMQAHATRATRAPACAACDHALAAPVTEASSTLTCASCKAVAIGLPAPAWLTAKVPTARYVIVTDRTAIAADANAKADIGTTEADHPIALGCTKCGAPLHITRDSERTVACEFCKTDVYLPDDLWRRLHPVKTMSPWFVRFEDEALATSEVAVDAEPKLGTPVPEIAKPARPRRGWLGILMIIGGVIGVVILARKLMDKAPPPAAITGAELATVAHASLKASPQELAAVFSAPHTDNFLARGNVKENGWFRLGHPCNGTVCIDTRSEMWGRIEVWWDAKHLDHPSGFTIAMQPGRWVEANDPLRKVIGDKLPNGLDGWGHWYKWTDRDILIDRNAGVKVWVTADDDTNPEWRTQLDAAWKLLLGVLFKVDVAPTPDELHALTAEAPAISKHR